MTTPARPVLGIGVHIPAAADPDGTIVKNEQAKASSRGFNLDVHMLDPNEDHDASIEEFKKLVQSKKYEAISIGFGLRGTKEFTPLFEKVVNVSIAEGKGAKLGFALLPTEIVEACERVL